jgi:hypothetical protein
VRGAIFGRGSSLTLSAIGIASGTSLAGTSQDKAVPANVIRCREETNATRSALNTAKLIDENPTLIRLKELEALEKVTEKIEKLTVFGGLDGLLSQIVKMK